MNNEKSLEERVKALEDLMQRVTQAFIVAPEPKQQTYQPHPLKQQPTLKTDTLNFPDLPQYITDLLKVTREGNVWIIKANYMSKDNFVQLADSVKKLGGKWISNGKNSRFEVTMK